MYTFVRDVTFKTMADALRAAPIMAEIVKYQKEASGVDLQLLRPVSGAPTRLRIVAVLDSLDTWQANQVKIAQDPAFHQLLGELSPLVDGSKTYDEIWR